MIVKADGVHLGQEDISCTETKKLAPSFKVGVSTHNIDEALKATSDGADYINIGPVFPTNTKETKYGFLGVEGLEEIAGRVTIPFTVMGGIKEGNIGKILSAGARRIAVVTEITMADNPGKMTRRLKNIIEGCNQKCRNPAGNKPSV
jgi:thiamine-phosphate pyrophosphorylase